MERAVYRCIAFNCYGEEPMIFIQRFIFAAFREGDRMFTELCTFLLDTLVSNCIKKYHFKTVSISYEIKLKIYLHLSSMFFSGLLPSSERINVAVKFPFPNTRNSNNTGHSAVLYPFPPLSSNVSFGDVSQPLPLQVSRNL